MKKKMIYVKKIKIQVNEEQKSILDSQSRICNWLYNHYLDVSKRYYKMYKKHLGYFRINKSFSKFKNKNSFLKTVHSKVLKNTLRSLDKSFQKFFKEKKGFPKFKSWKKQFRILEYEKNCGYKQIDNNHIQISFGKNKDNKQIKVILKTLEEIPKNFIQISLTKDRKNYYICFRIETEEKNKVINGKVVSLDLNQSNLFGYYDNKGTQAICEKPIISNYYDSQIDKVKSKRDKCKKYSNRFKYLNKTISRLYYKRREQIKLSLYTIANRIINNTSLVLVGDYIPSKTDITNINRKVLSQGLVGQFRKILEWCCYKNGISFDIVDEYNTSKQCSHCGKLKIDLKLSERIYNCDCGFTIHRDVNSAINIMNKRLPRTGETIVDGSIAKWKWMSNQLNLELCK